MRTASQQIRVGKLTDRETIEHTGVLEVSQVKHGESSTSYHLLHEWYSGLLPPYVLTNYFPDTDILVPSQSSSSIEYPWQSSLSRAFVLIQAGIERAVSSRVRVNDWVGCGRCWCSSETQ